MWSHFSFAFNFRSMKMIYWERYIQTQMYVTHVMFMILSVRKSFPLIIFKINFTFSLFLVHITKSNKVAFKASNLVINLFLNHSPPCLLSPDGFLESWDRWKAMEPKVSIRTIISEHRNNRKWEKKENMERREEEQQKRDDSRFNQTLKNVQG